MVNNLSAIADSKEANLEAQKQIIREVFVYKKDEVDEVSKSFDYLIENVLDIKGVKSKIYNRYLIKGLTDEEYKMTLPTVFGELPVDNIIDAEDFEGYKKGDLATFGSADRDAAYHKNQVEEYKGYKGKNIEAAKKFKKEHEKKYEEAINKYDNILNIEALPGQYDDRVKAVKDCLLITGNQDHEVNVFTTITFEGELTPEDKQKIRSELINPIEKHDVLLEKKMQREDTEIPGPMGTDKDFMEATDEELRKSENYEDMKAIQDYFKIEEGRDVNLAELSLLRTYWSEHCRHGGFNTDFKKVEYEGNNKNLLNDIKQTEKEYKEMRKEIGRGEKANSLMELAVFMKRYLKHNPQLNPNIENLLEGDEGNACNFRTTIELEDGSKEEYKIIFKNETHNHPTEVEPYGGAATCPGGLLRDIFAESGWVIQVMRISGSKDPTEPISDTIMGKLSQRILSQVSAQGHASYCNQIGAHAGLVREYFHPGYVAKHFELGYAIGGVPLENIQRKKPKKGDIVILIGGKTGRDGIGGATMSSLKHDSEEISSYGATVQKGNPVEERKIERLTDDSQYTKLVKKSNDLGAGGISVGVGELTRGITIYLDRAPLKYQSLTDLEKLISESQERMTAIIEPEDKEEVMQLLEEYNLEGTHIGDVTNNEENPENDRLVVMGSHGDKIVDIKRDFLDTGGAPKKLDKAVIRDKTDGNFFEKIPPEIEEKLKAGDFRGAFLESLKSNKVASQKGIGSQFDNSVGASNVLAQFGGKYQQTQQIGMVSRIPKYDGVDAKTTVISSEGFNPDLAKDCSYLGAMYAVILAASKNVALGGDHKKIRLTLQEYFGTFGKDPEKRGECYSALLGAFKAEKELTIPAIGGKDSTSGTFDLKKHGKIINTYDVPPSVVAFAANIGSVDKVVSAEFKKPGNHVYYVPIPKDQNGLVDWKIYRDNLQQIQNLIDDNKVRSSNVVETGGLAATITKMCLGNKIGFSSDMNLNEDRMFNSDLGGILLEVENIDVCKELHGHSIGKTTDEESINIGGEEISLDEVQDARTNNPLGEVFPTKGGGGKVDLIPSFKKATMRTKLVDIHGMPLDGSGKDKKKKIVETSGDGLTKNFNIVKGIKPKVLIPVFPGTNSELDTAHAVRKAGMEPIEFIFNNKTPEDLIKSTEKFAKLLKDCQMVVFPGGFSAGDEPDGSAKFIASVVRMNIVRDAMQAFLDKPDTLTLGICNGFQALIKLGLFDEGKIIDYMTEDSPTLTYNTTSRHMTDQVGLQVTSVLSPMMSMVDIGDTFITPISHSEGRIYMKDRETLEKYIKNGQVVMQYLDHDGNPTNEYNGSMEGIAALCSPKGRILGMMPHPERTGSKLFQNIPGNHDLPIFKSAAKEFGVKVK